MVTQWLLSIRYERREFLRTTVEVAVSKSPEDFAAFIKRETDRWAKVVKEVGITPH